MATSWDPKVYHRFSDQRDRAYFDLLGRVPDIAPKTIVDLGCATGKLTAALGERWPDAHVTGIDSSPAMVAAAPHDLPANVRVELGDIAEFSAAGVDLVFTNAALQWLPQHRELLTAWAGQLRPGGAIAWQVPGNFLAPSHVLMRTLAQAPAWKGKLGGALRGGDSTDTPEQYARLALGSGLIPDAWETTYLHLLEGENPVLDWVRGTGLRPVLDLLSPQEAERFEREYAGLLRVAYPKAGERTPFPFRRVFCVAVKP
ncbi:Trans-aconitate 2-methyltransferase [Segniliparus rotundus DSM 44985]|uniref:Trans-aconitate 2-methyltransferase n=1 Tax=Segniliparus rotundus (strain ATCC BAA-972 / CDC 1076 / CIP 108378 / DSM 44985 / JCM 13578) TaxID=640132 RepID=D6ZDT7_SEGRD|nr:methyltransferase domain-containing protein [Segniliparus rotundus]ADG99344.1 Trans-aconitate 2-methyltransferase [Segniliparus rotundus DSM 44985]